VCHDKSGTYAHPYAVLFCETAKSRGYDGLFAYCNIAGKGLYAWRDKSRGYDGLFAFKAWRILEGVAQAR
jgi:hypothetical protein